MSDNLKIGDRYVERVGDDLVAEVDWKRSILVYRHLDGTYSIINDGIIRHPNGDAEFAIRALAFYLQGDI